MARISYASPRKPTNHALSEFTSETEPLAREWRVQLNKSQLHLVGFTSQRVYSLLYSDKANLKAASELAVRVVNTVAP